MTIYNLQALPPPLGLETKPVMKRIASAHHYLAELKGVSNTIPNQEILINTLFCSRQRIALRLKNIITTHEEMYKAELFFGLVSQAAKEVQNTTARP